MDTLKTLGRRIRELRRAKNLTQAQLAEKCSLSDNFIALLERGKNAPSIGTLDELSNAFGISLSELFDFEADLVDKGEREKTIQKLVKIKGKRELRLMGEIAEVVRKSYR